MLWRSGGALHDQLPQLTSATECVIDSLGLSSLEVTVTSRGLVVVTCFASQIILAQSHVWHARNSAAAVNNSVGACCNVVGSEGEGAGACSSLAGVQFPHLPLTKTEHCSPAVSQSQSIPSHPASTFDLRPSAFESFNLIINPSSTVVVH